MAPKRSNPIEDAPPAASSSEEEEEEEEEEDEEEEEVASSEEEEEEDEEGSSQEEEEEEEEPKTQKSATAKKPETGAAPDESEESGSDSESVSDTEAHNIKPIATKPMEEVSNVKSSRSKPLTSTAKASSAKRPSESEQQAKEAKRPKKKAGEKGAAVVAEEVKKTGEDTKKQLFQRLFSEDDEIAVLKGMLEYFDKKGADPCADTNAFYDFVKKTIHTDVSKAQLLYKIRRLRKKFENNAGKGKKGEDRTFSKPHEQKAFELSKMIWGKEGITGKVESSAARSNGKAKGNRKASAVSKLDLLSSPDKKVEPEEPMKFDKKGPKSLGSLFDKRFGVGGLEEEVLNNGLDMIGEEKRAAFEGKWKKLQIAELELFLQRSELIKEQAKLLLEFYKSEDI